MPVGLRLRLASGSFAGHFDRGEFDTAIDTKLVSFPVECQRGEGHEPRLNGKPDVPRGTRQVWGGEAGKRATEPCLLLHHNNKQNLLSVPVRTALCCSVAAQVVDCVKKIAENFKIIVISSYRVDSNCHFRRPQYIIPHR